MRRIGYRQPLGLMIRPAARVIRELPPRPKSFRVAVFFRAAPLAAPTNVRSTCRAWKTKEPLSLTPVEEPNAFGERLPHAGSGSGLTAQLLEIPLTNSSDSISTVSRCVKCWWPVLISGLRRPSSLGRFVGLSGLKAYPRLAAHGLRISLRCSPTVKTLTSPA